MQSKTVTPSEFLSTLSLRRATFVRADAEHGEGISIHALLAESDYLTQAQYDNAKSISIHALLAESDLRHAIYKYGTLISIHALLAESDLAPKQNPTEQRDFYPRSPCGERLQFEPPIKPHRQISIHALLAESDPALNNILKLFPISIHALLAESDYDVYDHKLGTLCISIHALLAESDVMALQKQDLANGISIHALLAESDARPQRVHDRGADFYPRSPCGERPHH